MDKKKHTFIAGVICLITLAGCHTTEPKQNRFGDVSNRSEAVDKSETDQKERLIDPEELARMQAFLAEQVPREGVVRSFETPFGDRIDCVEVRLQPALKRADMRDHELQLVPRYFDEKQKEQRPSEQSVRHERTEQTYGKLIETCPEKSVPIRRLTLDTLKNFRTLEDFLSKVPSHLNHPAGAFFEKPELGSSDGHQYATVYRFVDNWGAESWLNLWKPYTEKSSEFTLSQIWVSRGSGSSLQTVEAGWQVYKDMYEDWRARLFVYFTPDNYSKNGCNNNPCGCYNLTCGKFVQVNNSVYIGGGFTSYSVPDSSQFAIKLLWYKDGPDGHWWLRYGDTWVGYYPNTLFHDNGLKSQGSRITFGGEIINEQTDGRHTRTDMGSGYWPYQAFGKSAYHRAVRYVDTSNFYQQASGMSAIITDPDCYNLSQGSSSDSWEQYFYFGGSGYNTQCE